MSLYFQTMTPCGWCNGYHSGLCPRVKAIEYHPNGTIARVEFIDDEPVVELVMTVDGEEIGRERITP